jgi:single-strand DNA-binding protein
LYKDLLKKEFLKMLNIVILIGRLTADPELRTTNNGVSVTSFSVAVDRAYTKEKQTDFINCVAWRNSAEFISKYFSKGQMIALRGSLQQNNYTDKDGNKRTSYNVVVDSANFCGGKETQSEPNVNYSNVDTSDFEEISVSDEDLPF